MENRVRFKIGEIEFEAEGSAEIIERERSIFLSSLLPAAVDAIMKTKSLNNTIQYAEIPEFSEPPTDGEITTIETPSFQTEESDDLSRTSLSSYLSDKGNLSEQDFILLSVYYAEKRNGVKSFTSEIVKQYYNDARRKKCTNISDALLKLAKKGLIMDDPDAEQKNPKPYILTDQGISFVQGYKPKNTTEKPKSNKHRKSAPKVVSRYSSLCADDLSLDKYPDIKQLKVFKEQMILIMYIVTAENNGEYFSVTDIQYLLTGILGIRATSDQINGVINSNKAWFNSEKDTDNQRANMYKLLQGAKSFAEEIISINS